MNSGTSAGWRSCVGMSADRCGVDGHVFAEGGAKFGYNFRHLRRCNRR